MFAFLIVLALPFADAMTADLAWKFSHTERTEETKTVHSFKTKKPVSDRTYLRFYVTLTDFETRDAATAAFQALVKKADPNTGLSYAWDTVLLGDKQLVHLAAPCLFSRKNYRILEKNLNAVLKNETSRSIRCDCGLGCGFTGGPRVLIHDLKRSHANTDELKRRITRVFQNAGWEVVDSKRPQPSSRKHGSRSSSPPVSSSLLELQVSHRA